MKSELKSGSPRFAHVERFGGRHADDVTEQVSRSASSHSMMLRSERFHGYLTSASVGAVGLIFVRYGAEVLLDVAATPERASITVPFGPMRLFAPGSGDRAGYTATAPFVVDQYRRALMRPDPEAGALVISTSTDALNQHFRALLRGRREAEPLRFATASEPPIAVPAPTLLTHAWRLVQETAGTGGAAASGLQSEVERFLLDAFVLSMPHTQSGTLLHPETALCPDIGERAREYLLHHHASPLSVEQVAHEVGVSVRQLQYIFARRFGQTPRQFLLGIRLAHAHELIAAAAGAPPDQRPTVATIALQAGFTHFGRFAAQYREHYGRNPLTALLGPRADNSA